MLGTYSSATDRDSGDDNNLFEYCDKTSDLEAASYETDGCVSTRPRLKNSSKIKTRKLEVDNLRNIIDQESVNCGKFESKVVNSVESVECFTISDRTAAFLKKNRGKMVRLIERETVRTTTNSDQELHLLD